MGKFRKITVALIVTMLLCMMLPVAASAVTTIASGTCGANGNNLTWTLDSNGTLTIIGTGAMMDGPDWGNTDGNDNRFQIRKVKIAEGVTSIGASAFNYCTAMQSITIPSSVTIIGQNAFSDCRSLTEVTIPNGVTRIEYGTFDNCWALESVTIPNRVTSIGDWAFYGCTDLKSITLPGSVTSLGQHVFTDCQSLNNLTIPASVKTIGTRAFGYAYEYGSYTLRSGVTITGEPGSVAEVYAKNNNITFIPLTRVVASGICGAQGENLTWTLDSNGTLNISGSGAMANYVYDADVPWYDFREQIKSVQIQNNVTSIGNNAFSYCANLTSVAIPESVTTIGTTAFLECASLTSVTIPKSVTYIGSSAFNGCTSLTSVDLPANLTTIGYRVFFGCSKLTKITIPSTVKSIGGYAFGNCKSLTNITIPSSVTSIGEGAFSGAGLTSISLPASVTALENEAFADCVSLTSIDLPSKITRISPYLLSGCTSLKSVKIPASVTEIGNYAFAESGLTSFEFPSKVKATGDYAFYKCMGLTSIEIPATITEISYGAYKGCANLTNVKMASSVKVIGAEAFANCTKLAGITLPSSVAEIREAAFSGCTSLTSIALPTAVTVISNRTFSGCAKLTGITFSPNTTKIGDEAFAGCASYKSITIPSAVQEIGQRAFGYYVNDKNEWARYSDVTIYGVEKTAAQTYATANKIPFVAIPDPDHLDTPELTSVTGNNKAVVITWKPVPGAVQYRVFYKTTSNWRKAGSATKNSYTWKGAKAGTTYTFTVRCLSADGKRYVSSFDSKGLSYTVPDANKVATPKITDITGSEGNVVVTWGAVDGAEQYRLFYKTSSGKWMSVGTTTKTSLTFKDAKASTTYTFTVRCLSANGKKYTSSYDKKGTRYKVPAAGKLATPKITEITGNAGNVKITWGTVPGAKKYRLFYKTTGGWKKLTVTADTSYVWKGAKANKTYTFTVRCMDEEATKYVSAYDTKGKTYTVPSNLLATPKITAITGKAGNVTITWGAVKGAEKYRLFYKTTAGWKRLNVTSDTSYVWTGAKANVTYTFTVRCMNEAGTKYTSAYDTKGKTYTVPSNKVATPQIKSITGGAGNVKVTWGAEKGAEKYRLFYKTTGGWKKIVITADTSYIWTGAKAGTTYTFTVRCMNEAGTKYTSSYDTKGTAYTVPADKLAIPKITKVSGNAGNVTITWGAVKGAEKYRLFYRTTGGWNSVVVTADTSYVWTGAKAGKTYTFTVRCMDEAGKKYTSSFDSTGVTYTVE